MKCPVFTTEGFCIQHDCKYFVENDENYCHYEEFQAKQKADYVRGRQERENALQQKQ